MHVIILIVFLIIWPVQTAHCQRGIPRPPDSGFRITEVQPQNAVQISDNQYFIDFGKDAFGTLFLKFRPARPDTLIIHLGEKATPENRVDRKPGGTIRYQRIALPVNRSQKEYTLKLPADKRNTGPAAVALPDTFGVIMPFRYCEIENLKYPLTGLLISQLAYHYRFNERAADFISSDTILNRVWDLCKYTIKATSFCGLYIDGDRERIPYEADALINQLSHYSVDNEYSMARNTNEYFMTHPTWPTEWILHTALLFYFDYLYTGDITPLARNYQALKFKTLMDLEREDGLISTKSEKLTGKLMKDIGFADTNMRIRDIVDWPEGERDGYEMAEINTVVNAFYYRNLIVMSEIAGYLGKHNDSLLYSQKSAWVREAINRKLFDDSRGIYIDGEGSRHASLHANLFPLTFGLVPDRYRESVVSFIKSRGMACSVYGSQYLLEGLYNSGESSYALNLLTSTGDRSWWNMIRSGSTIAMEAWDMKFKPNSDWNHAWGAAPANIISRCLWGITPAEPGFTKALIRPRMGNLTFSKIKVPTIRGTIEAEYKRMHDNNEVYVIDIPEKMRAEFGLSLPANSRILLNGKEIKPQSGNISLRPGSNRIVVK